MKKKILVLSVLAAVAAGGVLIFGHWKNTQSEILVDYGVDPWDINNDNPRGTCGISESTPEGAPPQGK
ncbi:MAG: hypothetical protein GY915_03455 [bacterium]|nr:hypothetical protein [bacterium]